MVAAMRGEIPVKSVGEQVGGAASCGLLRDPGGSSVIPQWKDPHPSSEIREQSCLAGCASVASSTGLPGVQMEPKQQEISCFCLSMG